MRDVIRQLERVRATSRSMLVARRLCQWTAAVLGAFLVGACVDYGLRLPGWLRLAVGLGLGVAAVVWLVRRVTAAARVWPDLSAIALRAERLFPRLSGSLASGVEFASRPEQYADSPRMAALTGESLKSLEASLSGVHIRGLIDARPTTRAALAAAAALLVAGVLAAADPASAALATRRWFAPLGDAQWPRRTQIDSLIQDSYWPSDTPVRLRARVTRGYRHGMRAWVEYRYITADGGKSSWASALMNDQSAAGVPATETDPNALSTPPGTFEALLEAPHAGAAGSAQRTARVEFHFEAGDDATRPQAIELIDRPALRALRVEIQPPAYAQGLAKPQQVALDQQPGQTAAASALVGSQVRWTVELNKPIPAGNAAAALLAPGLADVPGLKLDLSALETAGKPDAAPTITLAFDLRQTVSTPIKLTDSYGLSNLSDRLFRIEAVADAPPTATVTQPPSDESVAAAAKINLEAVAQDDVGIAGATLEAVVQQRGAAPSSPTTLAGVTPTPRGPRATVTHTLDLATLGVKPGDEVLVTAIAQDVFDLDGRKHDPVRSTTRRLRVIDPAAVAGQVRADLNSLREQAIRLESRQQDLLKADLDPAAAGQRDMSQRLDTQAGMVKSLKDRLDKNRVDDPALRDLLDQASRLVQQGEQSSKSAADKLETARAADARANPLRGGDQAGAMLRNSDNASNPAAGGQNQKPGEGKPGDKKPGEAKPSDAKPGEAKPGESKPSDGKPGEAKPGDAKPSDAKPGEAKPGESKPSDGKPGDAKPGSPQAQAQAAKESARDQQRDVAEKLQGLVSLLDQGKDTAAARGELNSLMNDQERLAQQTQDLGAKTLGKTPEQLTPEERKKIEENASKQAALSAQADALARKMQQAASAMARDNKPEQQAAAQALAEAAATAQRQGLSQSMKQASESAKQNRMADAGQRQQSASETMKQMMDQLDAKSQDARKQEVLQRQLSELAEQIQRLADQQEAQLRRAEGAQDVRPMDESASALRRGTLAAEERAKGDDAMKQAAQPLNQAAQHQADAIKAMRDNKKEEATGQQRQSLSQLQAALNQVKQQQAQAQNNQQQQRKLELKAEYDKLAARQAKLRKETASATPAPAAPGVEPPAPTRQEIADRRELGHQQADLQTDAAKLRDQVETTLLFKHLHTRIDRAASQAATTLRAGQSDRGVLAEQDAVVSMLKTMSDALGESAKADDPFSKPDSGQGQGGGKQGEAGGQQDQPQPLVPPMAELKLLRGMQQAVLDETKSLAAQPPAPANQPGEVELRKKDMLDLSVRQRELSGLGEQLINKVQQSGQPRR